MKHPPNILLLVSDQHRPDVAGCYGHPIVQTPHLDRLAERGARFDNAFTVCPLCGPARVSMLTGTHPHTHGVINHPNTRHRSGKVYEPTLSPRVTSLVRCLQDAGYQTHASGYAGLHLHADVPFAREDFEKFGFTSVGAIDYTQAVGAPIAQRYQLATILSEMWEPSYFNVEGEPFPHAEELMWDSLIAADAARFLQQAAPRQPFFLHCGFRAPHPPWCAPARFHALYDPANIGPVPDYKTRPANKPRRLMERFEYFDIRFYSEDMVRRSIAAYYAFVSYLDDCIGRVLRALETSAARDNTIVIYTSDHGENLYEHGLCEKHTLLDSSVRIPLIMAGSSVFPAGGHDARLASNIDILPTLLELAGVPSPSFVEGVSLVGGTRDRVYAEFYATLDPCRMVRDHDWKYIHTEDDICELYDLNRDAQETINLAWYPEHAQRVAEYDRLVCADWEVPDVPLHSTWNDLNERKQQQRLRGAPILDCRPTLPVTPATS